MKTQRSLIVVMASLVLSLLSLSITFTVTGSGHPPDQRKIVITVKIVDGDGKEITDAHVAVFQGEQHLGEGNSDAKGIAQMNVVVNTDSAVVLVLEVSKPGMETKEHTLKLGTSFPSRLLSEDIQLKPSGGSDTFILTVKAVDKEGNGIKQAHVNIYLGSFLFNNDYNVKPPTYQQDTNADGIKDFDIPMKPGKDLDITVEVSREDMQTERRPVTLRANLVPLDQLETFKLSPRTESVDEYPTVNIKVSVQDDQGNLEGALVAVTSDALTPSQRSRPHQKRTGPDGSATVAIELMSADPVEYIALRVSKPGYKEFKRDIPVNNKQHMAVGTTVEVSTIYLVKLPEGSEGFEVKVTVLDSSTNNGVPGAEVILEGPDYATSTTDNVGVATLPVDKPGSYKVRISQDTYRSVSDVQVHVLPKEKLTLVDPIHLVAKRTRDEAGDTLEIIVLAKESINADSETRPLSRAAVSDGRSTTYTDENGRAQLKGAYEGSQQITVTAKDYQPSTKRVGISKLFPLSKGTGSATFTLDPELTNNSPIRLIVEVRDAAEPHNLLNQANVYLQFKDKQLPSEKTPNGEPSFTLTGTPEVPLSKLRSGFRIYAKAVNYKPGDSDITTPEWLRPSLETHRATIFLERDWDALAKEVEVLEAKVAAWEFPKQVDPVQIQQFIEKATSGLQDAHALFNEFNAVAKTFPELTTFGDQPICAKVAKLQNTIRLSESRVNTMASELEQTIKDASARAPICSSPAAAESLKQSYRKAIQLLGEIGKLRNQAIRDHEDLSLLPYKASAAERALAQLKDKATGLQILADAAKQNESSAIAYIQRTYNLNGILKGSSTSVQLSLKAELAVLTVKVEGETGVPADLLQRINNMQGSLTHPATPDISANPRLPIVGSAPIEIARLEESATAKVAEFDRSVCQVITLDDAIESIKKRVDDAGVEVAFANDIPKLADVCTARTAKGPSTSTKPDTTENKPEDATSSSTGPATDKKPPAVDDDPGIKIAQPSKPNSQDTSSGGFWESAKAGKKKVENAVNNKPANQTNPATTGETSENNRGTDTATNKTGNKPPITVEEIPETNVDNRPLSNRPATKSANKPPVVEEIPETAGTNVASNRPASKSGNKPPVVEEIPETASTNIASNRPASKSGNRPPVVEEIPETAGTNVASNSPRANSPQVEEIPETSTTTNSSGGNQPNSSGTSGNSQAKEKPKKEKKPRDPNQPSKWEKAGKILVAIAAATNNQNQGTNTGGTTNTGDSTNGGGDGQSLNLAGTWSVTTRSTGDEEMNQNFTRTNVWQIWSLGGGGWRVRQVINGQTYDENYSTVDDGGGRFRLIGRNPDGSTYEMSGTYNQSQFSVATSGITISGTRQ
jgi:hypothetical protein